MTQNWRGTEEIDKIITGRGYIFGDAKAGGSLKNGKLTGAICGIDLGTVWPEGKACLNRAEELFESADLKTVIRENILHYLWVQYAINAGGWPVVVKAGSLGNVVKSHALMLDAFCGVKECIDLVTQRGVNIKQYNEISGYVNRSLLRRFFSILAMRIIFQHNEYIKRNAAHALADPKEIRTFFYDMTDASKIYHVEIPALLKYKDAIDSFCQ